jgi:hypothetical protein
LQLEGVRGNGSRICPHGEQIVIVNAPDFGFGTGRLSRVEGGKAALEVSLEVIDILKSDVET